MAPYSLALQSKLGSLSKDIAATTFLLQSLEPEVHFSSSTIPGAFVLEKTMQLLCTRQRSWIVLGHFGDPTTCLASSKKQC